MLAILRVQLLKLKRDPVLLIMMILLTILFTVALGSQADSKVTVYTFYDTQAVQASKVEEWTEILNESESFEFVLMNEDDAMNRLMERKADYALELLADDYRIVASVDNPNAQVLNQYVNSAFTKELAIRTAEAQGGADFREHLQDQLEDPVLAVEASTVHAEQDFEYDVGLQSLFGFTLFFVIYTIAFTVNGMLEEKQAKIWDRVILTPVTKTAMYSGHLLYSFVIGFVQILIVLLLFQYVFNIPLGDSFLTVLAVMGVYTFAIVALGMMLVGFVQTPQQMSSLIPIVGVSFAMLGGAFWPIEIVTNPVLIAISKVVPITHGMEALKGIVYYGHGWSELLQPIAILVLFGVVCMGIGINLVERRAR